MVQYMYITQHVESGAASPGISLCFITDVWPCHIPSSVNSTILFSFNKRMPERPTPEQTESIINKVCLHDSLNEYNRQALNIRLYQCLIIVFLTGILSHLYMICTAGGSRVVELCHVCEVRYKHLSDVLFKVPPIVLFQQPLCTNNEQSIKKTYTKESSEKWRWFSFTEIEPRKLDVRVTDFKVKGQKFLNVRTMTTSADWHCLQSWMSSRSGGVRKKWWCNSTVKQKVIQ